MFELPIYNALIEGIDEGIVKISLVDSPAVECNWVAFNEEKKKLSYSIENEEQRIIYGVIMRADYPIFRRDEDGFEYYIKYSKETIKKMAEKLMVDGYQNRVNLMHLENTDVCGVNLLQLFIKDTENGINPKGFEDIEDGSLFAQYKVENDAIWELIKEGAFLGFSLEGYFSVEREIKEQKNRSIMNRFKEIFAKMLMTMGAVATDKGNLIWEGDAELIEGVLVTIEDGTEAEDGVYETEDKLVTIEGGKVIKIEDKEAEVEEPAVEEPAVEEPEAIEPDEEEMKKKECMEEEVPAEESAEEEPAVEEAPVEEPAEPEYDAKAEIEALKAEVEALKSTLAEIAHKPAVEPITEQFEKVQEVKTSGSKGLDKALSRIATLKH